MVLISSLQSLIASMALVTCGLVTAQRPAPPWLSWALSLLGGFHSFKWYSIQPLPVASAAEAPSASNGNLLAGRLALRSEFFRASGKFWIMSIRTWRKQGVAKKKEHPQGILWADFMTCFLMYFVH